MLQKLDLFHRSDNCLCFRSLIGTQYYTVENATSRYY